MSIHSNFDPINSSLAGEAAILWQDVIREECSFIH